MATTAKSKKAAARQAKLRERSGSRWRVHYDIDGPRVRLGILWFAGAVVAFMVGFIGVVAYFGIAFAAASAQALRTWRARGREVDPTWALGGTAVVVALAGFGPRLMGLGVLALAALAVAVSLRQGEGDDASPSISMGNVGLVLQCALPTAVAGGSLVLLAEREIWAAVAIVFLVSAYESGDFLVGSGAANNVEGPLAGAAAVLVMSMAIAAGGFPPFDVGEAMIFGLLVAPLALAGQYLATAMLPHSRAFAPALRRVDSLLLAAPVWYFAIDAFVS
ncbi:hypothetical protein [Actinospongicola halichondriae]|uniref:hypothetical protein n=1 Tax=Actinospongicola halichondriae TaxID=3236844 RepID=UPI003D3E781B